MRVRTHIGLAASAVALAIGASGAEPAFLCPPQHVGPPQPQHALATRAFQGIPSLAVSPGGRLWATWYAGKTPGEDQNNYVVLSTSGDSGLSWRDVLVVDPDGEGSVRAFDPEVWLAPDGTLRLFWAQAVEHDLTVGGVWCLTTAEPEREQATWQAPARLTDGVMMCKPLVLSTCEWALPSATWFVTNSARMVVTSDQGRTWSLRGACNVPNAVRNCDEHMFVERANGDLWLLVRTTSGIGESVSADRGVTWPELAPSAIAHPTSRFFIRRLASGNLLLVKHGPLTTRTGRSLLTAFVSSDDGLTWGGGLLLDERAGVSYPDGQQAADGTIRIIYDYNRTTDRQILMAAFREADAAAGQAVSGAVSLRQLVSSPIPPEVSANSGGTPLRQSVWGTLAADGAVPQPLAVGATLFTDRDYTLSELPVALGESPIACSRARFLRLAIEGSKTVRCSRAGTVYFLTPAPARDPAVSQAPALTGQGFERVTLPEVRLFSFTAAATFCTLYQKTCAEGDTVTFGKWAVPFFFK